MKPTSIVPAHGDIGPGSILPTLHAAVLGHPGPRARAEGAGPDRGRDGHHRADGVAGEAPTWARVNGVAALARSAYAEAP